MGFAKAHHRHSFAEYLELEELSPVRHEFLDGEVHAIAGGTPEHAALCAALIVNLGGQLRTKPCRVFTSDLRLRIFPSGLATYPDAAVICGALKRDPNSATHVTNPTAIFEVLSPATEVYDLGEKREHCQQIDSLHLYVCVAQDRKRLEAWTKVDGLWRHDVLGAGQKLELTSIACEISVDSLYDAAGLTLR